VSDRISLNIFDRVCYCKLERTSLELFHFNCDSI